MKLLALVRAVAPPSREERQPVVTAFLLEMGLFLAIRDAFPKMIVFFGEGRTWRDEDGILRVPLKDFLAGDFLNSLERTTF